MKGLMVSLSQGAATLAGRVVVGRDEATPPGRMRIHLVPAEKESADDTLRYAEATAQSDGTFKFTNLAPGRYLVVARPLAEEESIESDIRPLAWDAGGRAGLRFEGEALGNAVELKPCQKVADFLLHYTPPVKPTPRKTE